jgi:8-oxo-dGTP pyrophosphatase MutT (NUDIX family)/transcriptional regulator with XRE-family HTH domain
MPESLTVNMLVAYNLTRVRLALGLSQEQARDLLKPFGLNLSKAAYSAAERSYDGNRVRQFSADDITAMSLAFGVPVAYFFLPPKVEDRKNGPVRSGEREVSWRDLYDVMYGGRNSLMVLLRTLELPWGDRPASTSIAGMAIAAAAPPPLRESLDAEREADEVTQLASELDPLPRPEPQPVIAAIITSPLGVLVTRRQDEKPPWGFIAGWSEPGESPGDPGESHQDTIIREAKEEAGGLRVEVGAYLGERVHPATGAHMIYYAAKPTHGTDVHVGDEGELAEVRWVTLSEAEQLMPDMFAPVRRHLVREIGER